MGVRLCAGERRLGHGRAGSGAGEPGPAGALCLRLAYRPPYDWAGMLAALSSRAAPGVEWVDKDVWHRRIDLDDKQGTVAVAHLPARNSVLVTIRFPCVKALPPIVARVRRVFDLGADIATIDSHLARDPTLAPGGRYLVFTSDRLASPLEKAASGATPAKANGPAPKAREAPRVDGQAREVINRIRGGIF